MAATYFGEVTQLDSRAVWYSDEEDEEDDNDDDLLDAESCSKLVNQPSSHEDVRSKVGLTFERLMPNPDSKIKECIVSLVTSAQYKNFKTNDPYVMPLGQYKNLCRAFVCPTFLGSQTVAQIEATLWLMFDQSTPWMVGMEVSYLVEALREQLYTELGLSRSGSVMILTKQFSTSEHLEYLSNLLPSDLKLPLPFSGHPTQPPSLIRNSFESALFEQLTLTSKLAYAVSLPDPRNYWFDKTLCWPTIPSQIIELRLIDDNLEKTLIFT